ncbi:MAG: hypothetical protein Q8R36_01180 [bacterium]|nr:hypothetical protein [bacterium]
MYQFFAKIILIFLGLVLGIVILEVGVRLFPDPPPPRLLQFIEPDPYIGTIYKKNLIDYIEAEDGNGTVPFHTNSHGFVGLDWNEKKEGVRIINLGDSFTVGAAVPYEKNYVSILGNILSESIKAPTESLNFGIVGQGTAEALETYRHYGRNADGEVVILWMYLGNDFYDNLKGILASEEKKVLVEVQEEPKLSFLVELLKKSKLILFVKDNIAQTSWDHRLFSILSKIPGMKGFIYQITLAEYPLKIPLDLLLLFTEHEKNGVALDETKKYIQKLNQLIKEDGGEFYVVFIPAHFQVDPEAETHLYNQYPELRSYEFNVLQPNRLLGDMLESLSIPFLDLTPVFANGYKEGRPLYICRFCHLSEKGHQLVAEKAAIWLSENYFKIP